MFTLERSRRRGRSALGDIIELQVRLAASSSLPVTCLYCRQGGQRLAWSIEGTRLDAWCYWPVKVQPLRLWAIRWIDDVGWGLDVETGTGMARLYAWQLRCAPPMMAH
jgi:hypothetical protein